MKTFDSITVESMLAYTHTVAHASISSLMLTFYTGFDCISEVAYDREKAELSFENQMQRWNQSEFLMAGTGTGMKSSNRTEPVRLPTDRSLTGCLFHLLCDQLSTRFYYTSST